MTRGYTKLLASYWPFLASITLIHFGPVLYYCRASFSTTPRLTTIVSHHHIPVSSTKPEENAWKWLRFGPQSVLAGGRQKRLIAWLWRSEQCLRWQVLPQTPPDDLVCGQGCWLLVQSLRWVLIKEFETQTSALSLHFDAEHRLKQAMSYISTARMWRHHLV